MESSLITTLLSLKYWFIGCLGDDCHTEGRETMGSSSARNGLPIGEDDLAEVKPGLLTPGSGWPHCRSCDDGGSAMRSYNGVGIGEESGAFSTGVFGNVLFTNTPVGNSPFPLHRYLNICTMSMAVFAIAFLPRRSLSLKSDGDLFSHQDEIT